MNDRKVKVTIGGLLHDIGKIVYRDERSKKNHSYAGKEFIEKNISSLNDKEIIDQIFYHHSDMLSNATLEENSLAYVTYIADNISAGTDRRKNEGDDERGFDVGLELQSVFNILNSNNEKKTYDGKTFEKEDVNYPKDGKGAIDRELYKNIKLKIKNALNGVNISKESINSILEVFEATSTFVPSSTNKEEIADISIFDHSKMTAAIGACILEYLEANNINDYKNELQKNAKTFYEKQAFLMFSMDISGIQDFIYTINSKGALKGLRSRSFYLEIMLENIIDEILEKLEYSRTNLIYSGGGHAYIIFANTKEIKNTIDIFIKGVNKWFLEYFNTSLYIAASYVECSANQLGMRSNKGNDEENHEEYKNIFKSLSNNISIKKSNRYSSGDILKLNESSHEDHSRECIICHRSDYLTAEDKCDICSNLEGMSQDIINKNSFFVVLSDDSMLEKGKARIILPVNRYLVACGENDGKKYIKNEKFVRIYSKNRWYEGLKYSTKLWVGDYVPEGKYTFEDLVKSSTGIERLCVLRADIDNLGQAFVSGFKNEHVSLSRVATFSRKLSIFFKKHINYLLENGEFFLDSVDRTEKDKKKRNIIIVYSGGDDVFLVGAWDDVIGASIDIRNAFKCFSQNTLTISAGIGIYPDKYPISAMARESGDLEDEAKKYKDKNGNEKNALTLFSEKFTFSWDEFIDKVINEKYKLIKEFFEKNNERGKNFLYNLLDYIRNTNEKINIARFAYLLSRMEPDEKKLKNQELLEEQKAIYNRFKKNMYSWIKEKDGASRKELEIAIYLYVYLTREKESDRDGK